MNQKNVGITNANRKKPFEKGFTWLVSICIFTLILNSCSPLRSQIQYSLQNGPDRSENTETPTGQESTPSLTQTSMSLIPNYSEIVDTELAWIASQQFLDDSSKDADGAITMYREVNDRSYVMPYFSNLAAWALLEKPDLYSTSVKKYMEWYFRHLNKLDFHESMAPCGEINGTVYDYWIEPDGKETIDLDEESSLPHYDSTDSYAATFLELARRYSLATQDNEYLIDHREDLAMIANVMKCTMQPDGLTWATPSYHEKLLMDNSEVYLGLDAVEWLAQEIFKDFELAKSYSDQKIKLQNAIENKLWNEDINHYSWSLHENGSVSIADLTVFYPDAVAQLYPAFGGVIDVESDRAKKLYDKFNLVHPNWSTLKDPAQNPAEDFPWAILSYQAVLMGDRTRADSYLLTVQNEFIDKGHPWPWYIMEAAFTAMTASKLINDY